MSENPFAITIYHSFLALCLVLIFSYNGISYASDEFLAPIHSSHEKIEQQLNYNLPNKHSILICFNYGCKTQRRILINSEQRQSLSSIFELFNRTQYGERLAIARSIALLEQIAATQTPVYNDKARNINDNNLPGRMDCIDSTINTTHYLEFINNLGLINRHRLQKPVYRSPYLMGQHWAAQIQDQNSGQSYAVDSWQSNNGQRPVIQDIENWKTRKPARQL